MVWKAAKQTCGLWTGLRSSLLISMLGKLSWFHLADLITMVLLMWKWICLFLRKNHLLRCWGWPLDIGFYVISIANAASKKVGALSRSMKFLSPKVALHLYKSTIPPYMEYCCHVLAGAPSCYFELLDKLQKRICRTFSPSLATFLEPLAHRRNVVSLSLFLGIGITLVDVLQNWLSWFLFLFLREVYLLFW